MAKSLRNRKLKNLIGTSQHFIGKLERKGGYEKDGKKLMVITPLYVLDDDGAYSYVGHAWMVVPDEYVNKQGYTIEFDGEVYRYKKLSGEKECGIKLVQVQYVKKADEFKGLDMHSIESNDVDKDKRIQMNSNFELIIAYEKGEDLSHKRKGQSEMKNFVRKVKRIQACGKHGWAWEY